jgi:hypothetical protein
MVQARNSVHSRMNAPGRTTRGFRFALLLRSSPPSRIPNEARSKDGADEPVNNKLAVPIHGRVAGPGKQQRSLAEPMQANQDKEHADDRCQDPHGIPFANLAERRQSSSFDTISRYRAVLRQWHQPAPGPSLHLFGAIDHLTGGRLGEPGRPVSQAQAFSFSPNDSKPARDVISQNFEMRLCPIHTETARARGAQRGIHVADPARYSAQRASLFTAHSGLTELVALDFARSKSYGKRFEKNLERRSDAYQRRGR